MRCIACNEILTRSELEHINPDTELPEDMCNKCLGEVSEIQDLSRLPYYDEIVGHKDCC